MVEYLNANLWMGRWPQLLLVLLSEVPSGICSALVLVEWYLSLIHAPSLHYFNHRFFNLSPDLHVC